MLMSGSGDVDDQGRAIGPSIERSTLSTWLEGTKAETLYILDTRYAGSVALGDGPEFLAASSWASRTIAGSDRCFMTTLAKTLGNLGGKALSVSEIFSILQRDARDNKIY